MKRSLLHARVPAVAAAAILSVALLAGCSDDAPAQSTSASVGTTVENGAHLAPSDFASAASTSGTILLDVRTPEEFAAGHLPGAVNIDVSADDFDTRISSLDPTSTYAVYCHSGSRSAVALQKMADKGFSRAYDLAGGIAAWSAAGGEVVTGQ